MYVSCYHGNWVYLTYNWFKLTHTYNYTLVITSNSGKQITMMVVLRVLHHMKGRQYFLVMYGSVGATLPLLRTKCKYADYGNNQCVCVTVTSPYLLYSCGHVEVEALVHLTQPLLHTKVSTWDSQTLKQWHSLHTIELKH